MIVIVLGNDIEINWIVERGINVIYNILFGDGKFIYGLFLILVIFVGFYLYRYVDEGIYNVILIVYNLVFMRIVIGVVEIVVFIVNFICKVIYVV